MHVAIVGGGIAGLAAAWELQQQGIAYTLLEASGRFGGKIVTEHRDGFIIEGAADSFLTAKPWALRLAREIGLGGRLVPTNPEQRTVYVLRHGRLHPFPAGMRLIVPVDPAGLLASKLVSGEGKRRMLAEVDVAPRQEEGDESLASFIRRRFGEEALTLFGDSLLAGIYAGDAESLSVDATFPDFPALEREYGSVTRGVRERARNAPPPDPDAPASVFVSFAGGLTELVDGLVAALTGDLRAYALVARITCAGVELETDAAISADATIVTTPARIAATLIHDVAPESARELAGWTTTSTATVTLAYRRAEIEHPLDGYGFVVPRGEGTRIIACTWSSTKLPGRAPDGHALLRVFFGGARRANVLARGDDDLVACAQADLRATMGITAEPVLTRVHRWIDANPQYPVGHRDNVSRVRHTLPPWLTLAGCAYDGVGIPDSVRQGREAALAVVARSFATST